MTLSTIDLRSTVLNADICRATDEELVAWLKVMGETFSKMAVGVELDGSSSTQFLCDNTFFGHIGEVLETIVEVHSVIGVASVDMAAAMNLVVKELLIPAVSDHEHHDRIFRCLNVAISRYPFKLLVPLVIDG